MIKGQRGEKLCPFYGKKSGNILYEQKNKILKEKWVFVQLKKIVFLIK